MAVICTTCGLPEDLCACGDLDKDSNHIIIRLETRRFKKKGTMIEGLDPKINNLESVGKDLKKKYACCLLYTSPSPRDGLLSRMPSSA